jgi:hypothetical protein
MCIEKKEREGGSKNDWVATGGERVGVAQVTAVFHRLDVEKRSINCRIPQ